MGFNGRRRKWSWYNLTHNPEISLERLRKITRNFSLNVLALGQDLNLRTQEVPNRKLECYPLERCVRWKDNKEEDEPEFVRGQSRNLLKAYYRIHTRLLMAPILNHVIQAHNLTPFEHQPLSYAYIFL
jgi:hypothetical protein